MIRRTLIPLICLLVICSCIRPRRDFEKYIPPPVPDYSKEECWAALPWKHDAADTILPGASLKDGQDSAKVDVFFIYPTLNFSPRRWNADVHDKKLNRTIDETTIAQQASVYNGSCKVYVPRYRQATLYSFIDKNSNGTKALNLAYSDVRNAFKYYLDHYNLGRPMIIAGHSQGTLMAYRLLKEFFDTTALRQKLVAAYLIGYRINADSLKGIPVEDSAAQTGCLISWNTVKWGGLKGDLASHFTGFCVNPLSWKRDTEYCDPSMNKGSIVYSWKLRCSNIAPHVTGAACRNGELWIDKPAAPHMFAIRGSYHLFDYSLFYLNIRENVALRVAAYLNKKK